MHAHYLEDAALQVLQADCDQEKLRLTDATLQAWRQGQLQLGSDAAIQLIAQPGRPERPQLVAPGSVPRRSLQSSSGRAALIHAIAHIELNAIDLAWDAVYRFRSWPDPATHLRFAEDWMSVAEDEARHFALLRERLQQLGHDYGDFDAHNGLWEAAVKTMDDPLARMALVPRVLEARGLDVTPGMIERLRGAGDPDTVAILEVILREEVAHVAAGTRWFHYLCEQRGLARIPTFLKLVKERFGARIKEPLNHPARKLAGFSEDELLALVQLP